MITVFQEIKHAKYTNNNISWRNHDITQYNGYRCSADHVIVA